MAYNNWLNETNGGDMKKKFTARWTGLYDKNGKKICRGDWVTHPLFTKGKVIWFQPYCAFLIEINGTFCHLNDDMNVEVITKGGDK